MASSKAILFALSVCLLCSALSLPFIPEHEDNTSDNEINEEKFEDIDEEIEHDDEILEVNPAVKKEEEEKELAEEELIEDEKAEEEKEISDVDKAISAEEEEKKDDDDEEPDVPLVVEDEVDDEEDSHGPGIHLHQPDEHAPRPHFFMHFYNKAKDFFKGLGK